MDFESEEEMKAWASEEIFENMNYVYSKEGTNPEFESLFRSSSIPRFSYECDGNVQLRIRRMSKEAPIDHAKRAARSDVINLVRFLTPARTIDVETTAKYENDNKRDFPANVWNVTLFNMMDSRYDYHGPYYLCAVVKKRSKQNKTLTPSAQHQLSIFNRIQFRHESRWFDDLVLIHRDNEDEIREQMDMSFDEAMQSIGIPGKGQFLETFYNSIPFTCLGKWLSDGNEHPHSSLQIFPNKSPVTVNGSAVIEPAFLFVDQDGGIHSLCNNLVNAAGSYQSDHSIPVSGDEIWRYIEKKTSAIPHNAINTRKKDWSCNCLFDFAGAYQTNKGQWDYIEDLEEASSEFIEKYQMYKSFSKDI